MEFKTGDTVRITDSNYPHLIGEEGVFVESSHDFYILVGMDNMVGITRNLPCVGIVTNNPQHSIYTTGTDETYLQLEHI